MMRGLSLELKMEMHEVPYSSIKLVKSLVARTMDVLTSKGI